MSSISNTSINAFLDNFFIYEYEICECQAFENVKKNLLQKGKVTLFKVLHTDLFFKHDSVGIKSGFSMALHKESFLPPFCGPQPFLAFIYSPIIGELMVN